jgi:hypothetical protein
LLVIWLGEYCGTVPGTNRQLFEDGNYLDDMTGRDLATCPECGTEFRKGRLACPECGSDAETGWKDEAEVQYQSVELPDEEWRMEPGTASQSPSKRWFWIAAILAILAMLIFVFVR